MIDHLYYLLSISYGDFLLPVFNPILDVQLLSVIIHLIETCLAPMVIECSGKKLILFTSLFHFVIDSCLGLS